MAESSQTQIQTNATHFEKQIVGPHLAPCFAELWWKRALCKFWDSRPPKRNLTTPSSQDVSQTET